MRSRSRRGSTQTIAQVFLIGFTVIAGSVLWAYKPPLPQQSVSLEYVALGGQSEQAWGDGSDCSNVNRVQACLSISAIDIVFTAWSANSVSLSSLTFLMFCNGTVYLTAPLTAMEWVPGSTATVGGNAPQLQKCGTFVPPNAPWNRLAFFQQLQANAPNLMHGDQLVLYEPFEPPNCPHPQYQGNVLVSCDDDFHGAPSWCFTIEGACSIEIASNAAPTAVVTQIALFGLGS